jgi:hypothetical protein
MSTDASADDRSGLGDRSLLGRRLWARLGMRAAFRRLGIGVFAVLFATMALSACAATTPAWDPTSDGPVYLVNNTTTVQFADGSAVDWNTDQGVVLAAVPVLTIPTDEMPLAFPAPTNGAVDFQTFLAPKGSERMKTAWKAWDDPWPLNGKGALLPALWPGYLSNGNPKAVKNAGGTYSMGIAYLKDNDQTVVSAYYTTITVDAGKGTWKFTTPPRTP